MRNAYSKDIMRAVRQGRKRFFSLMLITVLGVTMMCGLKAACVDLRKSADAFFDRQRLFDIVVLSTLGLTDSDVRVLSEMEGVEAAEGAYSTTVYTVNDGKRQSAEMKTLSEQGINQPYVLEGTLPQSGNEAAVTKKFLKETGKKLGDTFTIEKDTTDYFTDTVYTITALVIDAADVNNTDGAVAFRAAASADYTFFTVKKDRPVNEDEVYSAVYLVLDGSREQFCFSAAYEGQISAQIQEIESQIQEEQEKKRSQAVLDAAYAKFSEVEEEVEKQLGEAREQLSKAQAELEDGKAQLEQGEQELDSKEQTAKSQFAAAWREIGQGYAKLSEAEQELAESENQIKDAENQLAAAKVQLDNRQTEAYVQLEAGRSELETKKTQLQGSKEQILQALQTPGILEEEKEQLQAQLVQIETGLEQIAKSQKELETQKEQTDSQFAAAWQELAAQEAVLSKGRQEWEAGRAELEKNKTELDSGAAELTMKEASAKEQIESGRAELEENRVQLEQGEQELLVAKAEFEEKQADAEEELKKARAEISQMEMAQWYVQDRTSLSGYSNIKSDASCIEAIGTAFPVLFLTVAILISLTTITRMVEEDRGLIGTYKALGFTNWEILKKYLFYAFAASLIGGLIGDVGGFVVLPEIIFVIFRTMYVLPVYTLQFDWVYGIGGILLFTVGIGGATLFACREQLRHMPAALMRSKAPRLGARVFLERLPFLWKRFSFLNKVTARNLFRYKKRLFMTVSGICGCTALLLCGFAIKDTVTELMPGQYERIYQYDCLAAAASEDNEKLLSLIQGKPEVAAYLNIQVEMVKIKNVQGEEQKVQMIVVPDGGALSEYIHLEDMEGNTVQLDNSGVFLTNNAVSVLGLKEGETIAIQNLSLVQKNAYLEKQVLNYLGNTVYMTQQVYEELFGTYQPNGILVNLSEQCADKRAFAEDLGKQECVVSSVSTQELKQDFSKAFALIHMVVYIVIIMAAGLALVVLFTLSTTNISERERELATIKVLGFYDREVHLYVNKETVILTLVGILVGLPVGRLFGFYIMHVLKLPAIYFAVTVHEISYVIAAVIALCFALAVDCITDRILDNINPVEALKSVE